MKLQPAKQNGIQWNDPYEHNGLWWVHVEGLTGSQLNMLYRHELVRGSFVFPHPQSGKAHVRFNSEFVKKFGAIRCFWLLRESIIEYNNSENFWLATWWNTAITDAIARPDRYAPIDDGYPEDDETSPYGTI